MFGLLLGQIRGIHISVPDNLVHWHAWGSLLLSSPRCLRDHLHVLTGDCAERYPCSFGMGLALDNNKLVEPSTCWGHCDISALLLFVSIFNPSMQTR